MITEYTPASPPSSPRKKEPSQQPDDTDEEDILTSVSPEGMSDESVKTFIFKNQGHTLGNVLRDQLIRYSEVHFCGYSIPHPGERVMHLRIQTLPSHSATEMLRKALEDITKMCDHVEDAFNEALSKNDYEKEEPPPTPS